MTSSFIAILHLDFVTAYEAHVLSIPLFIGIMGYSCLSVTDILLDRNDIEYIESFCKRKIMITVCNVPMEILFICLIVKMVLL